MAGSKGFLLFLYALWQPGHFPESGPVCPPFTGIVSDADFRGTCLADGSEEEEGKPQCFSVVFNFF